MKDGVLIEYKNQNIHIMGVYVFPFYCILLLLIGAIPIESLLYHMEAYLK